MTITDWADIAMPKCVVMACSPRFVPENEIYYSHIHFFEEFGLKMRKHDDVTQGARIRLVPYLEEHVPLYHSWLSDPEIQRLTCTEPTTLQEEYEYQKDWGSRDDRIIKLIEADGVLIGDISLFKGDQLDKDCMWEVNIMVVKEEHRRHGYAGEALELMLKEHCISNVMAKVHKDNHASINFFRKSFQQVTDEPDAFGNITFIRSSEANL